MRAPCGASKVGGTDEERPTAADRIHRTTSADGTEIAGHVHGQGPPLVLVHGGIGSEESWRFLVPLPELDAIRARFHDAFARMRAAAAEGSLVEAAEGGRRVDAGPRR